MPSTSSAFTSTRCFRNERAAALSRFLTAVTSRTSLAAPAWAAAIRAARQNPNTCLKRMLTQLRDRPNARRGALQLDPSRALAEVVGWHAGLVQHRDHEIRQRRARLHFHVAVPLEPARAAADQQDRQVVVRVLVPVAHAAAVEERRVIQEVAVAVGRRPEPLEEAGEELQMVRVDLGFLGDLFRNAVVVL